MRQRNLLYITNIDFSHTNGYPEKILGQMDAFANNFDETKLICRYNGKTVLLKSINKSFSYKEVGFTGLLPIIKKASFVYIRWPILTPKILLIYFMIYFFQICVISEIPTYPFKKELENYSGLRYLYLLFSEKVFRPIVTYVNYKYSCIGNEETSSSDKLIFFENGISKFNEPRFEYLSGNDFNFIFVGNFGRHYSRFGLDRFIEGLRSYDLNSEQAVNLHIVGVTREEFIITYGREVPRNIFFHGYKSAKDLDELIMLMNFGVGILGFHRVGIYEASPLKERLYLSCGLPYVSSVIDSGVPEWANAKIAVEANDQAIDIDILLKEVHKKKMSSLKNKLRIFKYSQQNLHWAQTMHAIFEAYRQYE
jgi:hypothetical protein